MSILASAILRCRKRNLELHAKQSRILQLFAVDIVLAGVGH